MIHNRLVHVGGVGPIYHITAMATAKDTLLSLGFHFHFIIWYSGGLILNIIAKVPR